MRKMCLDKPQFLYVITDGEFLKIGISNAPKERLRALQHGNVKELRCIYVVQYEIEAAIIEQYLHSKLEDYNIRGEWFYTSLARVKEELLNYVKKRKACLIFCEDNS